MWGWLMQQMLNPTHELLVLAPQIDGEAVTDALRPYYHRLGRYAKPIRLMVGLHLLKHRWNLSDARVVQGLHENLSWMTFCGIDIGRVFEQATPGTPVRFLEASTRTKWRQRLGPEGTHALEAVLQQPLVREKVLDGRSLVTDTTVQEKPVAYPTDTALLDKGRRKLLTLIGTAKATGVAVAQGLRRFRRTAKRVVLTATKLGKDPLERMQAANRQLSTMAQQVLLRVPRVLAQLNGKLGALRRHGHGRAAAAIVRLRDQLEQTAGVVRRVIHQNAERFQGRHVPAKVLSLHAPHGVSIRKGKRAKTTEYGAKVSLAIDRRGFVITHTEYAWNIADADTLPAALAGWRAVFGRPPPELAGDRGLHHPAQARVRLGTAQVARVSMPPQGKTRHPAADTAWFKRLQRLRAHIEPVIGHLKTDHRLDRCRYKGFAGDQLNVSWAVLAWNTKKWGRLLQQRRLVGSQAARRVAERGSSPGYDSGLIPVTHRRATPKKR
jgi:IS5 family transposase